MSYTPLTPDWILLNLTTGHTCDANNQASIVCVDNSSHPFICESIIRSFYYIFVVDETENNRIQYFFNVDDIRDNCPETYAELIALKP